MNKQEFEKLITHIPDFPKVGVTFMDVSPLLKHRFDDVITDMCKNIDWSNVDYILGIESRGFILGSAMAIKQNKGFIPVRKKGKLPPPTIGEDYSLEYGHDTLEMKINKESAKIVIVDDVIATGGTLKATIKLCERNNFQVQAISMLINLRFLNQLDQEFDNIHSVLNFD
ncbi:MAG: adenine phosphoribosyltransferase [Halobacteriovoraceae bacterium]|jgi:adenine phosphoribosyltransferase|nr:adenine phosphoribosyltransferase [Halobacteriovoraceae bacterium]